MTPAARDMNVRLGHLYDKLFYGLTRFEHGVGRLAIFLRENHLQVIANSGSGKFARHGAFVSGWGAPGGGLFISPKSFEWANFGVARRSDPSLWHSERGRRRNLGVNPAEAARERSHVARFHIPNGRCFIVAPDNQSVFPGSCYNPRADIDFAKPEALSRVLAVAGASFPAAPPTSNRDSWFWQSPTGALAAAWAYLNLTDPDPRHHTLAYALRWIMGYDENPRRLPLQKDKPVPPPGSPAMQRLHFIMLAQCHNALSGRIALAGNSLMQLSEKSFGSVISELETKASWLLDPRYQQVMNGESDFALSEIGVDGWPVTVYVSPVQGEGESGDAFLRMMYKLASLIFLQRSWRPKQQILMVGDEIGSSWGKGLREEVLQLLTLGRYKNVSVVNYWQDVSQIDEALGAHGRHTALGNSATLLFGLNDDCTRDFASSRLGRHTIKARQGWRGASTPREVDLASADAIDRELAMTSPLAYVFSPARRPMCVHLPAFKDITTPEGAFFQGMPGMDGHYEEFA